MVTLNDIGKYVAVHAHQGIVCRGKLLSLLDQGKALIKIVNGAPQWWATDLVKHATMEDYRIMIDNAFDYQSYSPDPYR